MDESNFFCFILNDQERQLRIPEIDLVVLEIKKKNIFKVKYSYASHRHNSPQNVILTSLLNRILNSHFLCSCFILLVWSVILLVCSPKWNSSNKKFHPIVKKPSTSVDAWTVASCIFMFDGVEGFWAAAYDRSCFWFCPRRTFFAFHRFRQNDLQPYVVLW